MALLSILADVLWHIRASAMMTIETDQPDRLFICLATKKGAQERMDHS